MSNLVCINQQPLEIKEYKGQKVLTLSDIDAVHKRPEGTAKRNFRNNKEHFIEGVDFFVVNRNELGTNFVLSFNKHAHHGVFLTESGYLMLVKSFTDDLAWDVQRQLINCYFNNRTPIQENNLPKTYEKDKATVKMYKGRQVMTMSDIVRIVNSKRCNIHYQIKRNQDLFIEDVDYHILEGRELKRFKKQNKGIAPSTSALFIMEKSGLDKLATEILKLPIEERFGVDGRLKSHSKMHDMDEEMKQRYLNITLAQIMLDATHSMANPFQREAVFQYITEIMINEGIWTENVNGYNGVSSNFDGNTLEGWNKIARLNHSEIAMKRLLPLNPQSLDEIRDNMSKTS